MRTFPATTPSPSGFRLGLQVLLERKAGLKGPVFLCLPVSTYLTMRFGVWSSILLGIGFLVTLVWRCSESEKKPTGSQNSQLQENRKFVDVQQCASCHKEIVESYRSTGKGRSFFKASARLSFENWETKPVYDPASDFYYLPYRLDSLFFIKEFRIDGKDTTHSRTEKIDYFIGSGNQTRSYLFERNGYLFEHPITWYSRKKIWDLSPGYEKGANHRFDRKIGSECMFCHNTGARMVPNSENRYTEFGSVVGCESCHGPVDKHVERMRSGKAKKGESLLVDLKTIPPVAKLDLCRQCHLEGIKVRKSSAKPGEYEPGKLFSDYYEVFIPATGATEFGFASHGERLQLSTCFKQSAGKMTCTSCHDPHGSIPPNKAQYFSLKCQSCHESGHEKVCSKVKIVQGANCIKCHMQAGGTTDIPHVNSTDHWIRRRLDVEKKAQSSQLIFKNFASDRFAPSDLAKAKLSYAEGHPESQRTLFEELTQYLKSLPSPHDADPSFRLKFLYLADLPMDALVDTQKLAESTDPYFLYYGSQLRKRAGLSYLPTLQKASATAPDWVDLRYRLAVEKEQLNLNTVPDYEQILQLDSLHSQSLTNLGFHWLEANELAKAEKLFRKALRSNPDYVLAQENLVRCLMSQGKFEECKKRLDGMIRKNPGEPRYPQLRATLP